MVTFLLYFLPSSTARQQTASFVNCNFFSRSSFFVLVFWPVRVHARQEIGRKNERERDWRSATFASTCAQRAYELEVFTVSVSRVRLEYGTFRCKNKSQWQPVIHSTLIERKYIWIHSQRQFWTHRIIEFRTVMVVVVVAMGVRLKSETALQFLNWNELNAIYWQRKYGKSNDCNANDMKQQPHKYATHQTKFDVGTQRWSQQQKWNVISIKTIKLQLRTFPQLVYSVFVRPSICNLSIVSVSVFFSYADDNSTIFDSIRFVDCRIFVCVNFL